MTCPMCQKETARRFRPFCSQRCADLDLGRWLMGSYVLVRPINEEENEADVGSFVDPHAWNSGLS
ncbi:MAG: DNA gyrase inhibitor YacG [Pseudomonadota bacterium]